MYSLIHSGYEQHDLDGPLIIIQPLRDRVAWKALEYYAVITPNVAQRQALYKWLAAHPCPGEPEVEQLEMEMEMEL